MATPKSNGATDANVRINFIQYAAGRAEVAIAAFGRLLGSGCVL
jgi:hypothetical protein